MLGKVSSQVIWVCIWGWLRGIRLVFYTMACCGSPNEGLSDEQRRAKIKSMKIEQRNQEEDRLQSGILRLLLLGAGESGKSTIFKQLNTIYGEGYPVEERKRFDHIIYNNLYLGLRMLIVQAEKLHTQDPSLGTGSQSEITQKAREFLDKVDYHEKMTEETASMLKSVWQDPGIIKCWDLRSTYQLPYPVDYLMSRIDDISSPDYIPSYQDILRSRVRTTGIVELEFSIAENSFVIMDVGGQRNERRKWLHCFSNVTCVIFVAAISEYDQVLYEDNQVNRLQEALSLFEEICNSKFFKSTPMILFLNKKDIFQEKLEKSHLNVCFEDYHGAMDYESASHFILQKFLSLNRTPSKNIFPHFTCATDTEMVRTVFQNVRDIILNKQIKQMDLVN